MEKCTKCGVEIPNQDDSYKINDKVYCEDCAIVIKEAGNPGKRCGD